MGTLAGNVTWLKCSFHINTLLKNFSGIESLITSATPCQDNYYSKIMVKGLDLA
jgi:hypothetical protein